MPKYPVPLGPRHPRNTLAFLVVFFLIYWFLSDLTPRLRPVRYKANHELHARLEREERKYREMLPQRHDLITRFGPTPAQVVMFPPDQDPWPAYTVWDFFPPIFNCPHELDRLGALGDGGKWICGISRIEDKPDCVVYSFGIDSSYSFEAALLRSTRFCQVWIYDSTKGEGAKGHVPRELRHRAHFGKLALGATDRHADDPERWTLRSLMAENGHTHVDFLRLDVEGWEWETFRAIVRDFTTERGPVATPTGHANANGHGNPNGHANGNGNTNGNGNGNGNGNVWSVPEREGVLPFGQLQIELHVWNQRFQDFLEWWELLETAGLRPFHNEVNLVYANYNRGSGVELAEYSFLNVRGDNAFVKDYVPLEPDGARGNEEKDRDGGRDGDGDGDGDERLQRIRHGPGPEGR